jgi:hypothetical protein
MRCMIAGLLGVAVTAIPWTASRCQPVGLSTQGSAVSGPPGFVVQPADPCAPTPNTGTSFSFGGIGSAIGMLGNLAGQAQRQRACAAQRQAQWDAYQAKQMAAATQKPAASAPAQAAPAQAAPAQAAPAQAAPAQAAPAQAALKPQLAAAAQPRKTAPARVRAVAAPSQPHTVALAEAENSADNVCREQAVARAVMTGWNGIDQFKAHGVTVIDIEHLTTSAADRSAHTYTCHGVYVTDQGDKVMGSITVKRNVVGDPIAIWTRDADQELSHYRPPAAKASKASKV